MFLYKITLLYSKLISKFICRGLQIFQNNKISLNNLLKINQQMIVQNKTQNVSSNTIKVDKYDRQIRIWGTKGQKRLTQAKVAIVGCCGPTIQAAKNLILPGIGQVDILDNKYITVEDLSSSFFYQHDSVGKLRGQQCSKNLLEMNPDVAGCYRNVSVQQIIQLPQQYIKPYTLVICGNLLQTQNKQLSQLCLKFNVPVIFITSVGFYFHVRSQKQQHIVQSQNTSSKKYYLRLHDPFQELHSYIKSKQLPQLISQLQQIKKNLNPTQYTSEYLHQIQKKFDSTIYPVFLVEAFSELKKTNGKDPTASQLKNLLNQWKSLVQDRYKNGINEAFTRSLDLYQPVDNFLSDMTIFDDPKVLNATQQSQFIYVFLKSVLSYMKLNNNSLPQIVRLPDFNTSTKEYLDFKNIYKREHQKNKQQLKKIIVGLFPSYKLKIDDELLSQYINNIDALKIVNMKSFSQELENPDINGTCLNYLADQKSLFLALRGYKIFETRNNRSPKVEDFQSVAQIVKQLCSKWQLDQFDQRYLKQICRYEGKSLISYDSIAGAITGQESVKLITNCFEPMNNGYFFDGIQCKGFSLRL